MKQNQRQGACQRGWVVMVLGLLPGLAFCQQQINEDAITNRLASLTDNSGFVTQVRDAAGHITSYTPDAMGRLHRVAYPTGDPVVYHFTVITYFGMECGRPVKSIG